MKAAFDAAWKFVVTDPFLEEVSVAYRRLSLGQALMALVSSGERDVAQLANDAIDQVRRLHTPLPSARIGKKGIVKRPVQEGPSRIIDYKL